MPESIAICERLVWAQAVRPARKLRTILDCVNKPSAKILVHLGNDPCERRSAEHKVTQTVFRALLFRRLQPSICLRFSLLCITTAFSSLLRPDIHHLLLELRIPETSFFLTRSPTSGVGHSSLHLFSDLCSSFTTSFDQYLGSLVKCGFCCVGFEVSRERFFPFLSSV